MYRKVMMVIGILLLGVVSVFSSTPTANAAGGKYVILAWNDLGMHCYNRDFADLAVLPPFNTLWVQVVRVGNPPKIVTQGIKVSYFYADNTYSVGKQISGSTIRPCLGSISRRMLV